MRKDFFFEKKGIHFTVDKEVHLKLRALLFQEDLNMSEIFQEFAERLVAGDPNAVKIVSEHSANRIRRRLNLKPILAKEKPISERDLNVLYDLIGDGSTFNDEPEKEGPDENG